MATKNLADATWGDVWLAQATEWIGHVTERLGLAPTGRPPVRAHVRPWPAVLRVPTKHGPLWFKAHSPSAVREARVLRVLHALPPARITELVIVDVTTGWFPVKSAGALLPHVTTLEVNLCRREALLSEYPVLQHASAAHAGELVAAGAPGMRSESLADTFASVLDDPDSLWLAEPGGLTQYDGLLALRSPLWAWRDELTGLGITSTILHDDRYTGNVFAGVDCHVFIDWAGACVSHPFGSQLHPEREVATRWELPPDAPEIHRLRTVCFGPWAATHDPATLHRARRLALAVTCVMRALAWRRALEGGERSALKEYYASPEPRWLRHLLHTVPLSLIGLAS